MTRSLLFIAAVLSPSNQENIQTDGDERKTMEDLTGSFPFSLSTNCLASIGYLKPLCQENGFQGDSSREDDDIGTWKTRNFCIEMSRFDGGALLILKGLHNSLPSSLRPGGSATTQTLEKSQFLIDSFCRCVIDWASCGEW